MSMMEMIPIDIVKGIIPGIQASNHLVSVEMI